ncbi:sigma-54-dependent Fis family transcriptional regulator [Desulforhopalus singaporensis]|uniref:Transcriptional regulator containing GAF, AAA-type ATPase, and DNA-binding Fis domains n=1 Tax=Desulforhopalus singaporensis TaxID=91360 RepID=A0A1H0RXY6_9BACT|nr:sigma 54-interacting transcriptional regulator [Desulforhopalus singaporensis]SDP34245.1 Transcriptional regulator containing GAF, AAA-type ATPase, and DNA-binding Fis domains [Desulforhopalus singaporensis]
MEENDFFREITLRICGTLDLENGIRNCLKFLRNVMPADGMFFARLDMNKEIVQPLIHSSLAGSRSIDTLIPIIGEECTSEIEELQQEKVLIRNEPKEHPIARIIADSLGSIDMSFLVMPLIIDERQIGILNLYTLKTNAYTETDAHFYNLLHHPFAIAMSNAMEHREVVKLNELLADDNRFLHREMLRLSGDQIIGAGFGLKAVVESVNQIASLDRPVLLLGETGAGKEVIANAIHFSSPRSQGPFIKVNCGAIPDQLIDSELFGHEKGAFTGAINMKRGRFERADKGTILLDEIGELPQQAQVRLLRVLQNREFERVGGTSTLTVDARVIAATNRNLEEMVRKGDFREDLLFRLNVFPITIPPLRQRREDIPALVTYFLDRKSKELGIHAIPELAAGSMALLKQYRWPGNVRELENKVEQALIRYLGRRQEGFLEFEGLKRETGPGTTPPEPEQKKAEFLEFDEHVRQHILEALHRSDNRIYGKRGAARLLNINPSTLRSKMKKLGISLTRAISS